MQLDSVTQEFVNNHKRYCSITTIKWWQGVHYIVIFAVLTFMVVYRWDISLCLITFYFAAWYFIAALFRGFAVLIALLGNGVKKISDEEIAALRDDELPVFTILIPLYKEAMIADKIIRSMENLDYPHEKLDIEVYIRDTEDGMVSLKADISELASELDDYEQDLLDAKVIISEYDLIIDDLREQLSNIRQHTSSFLIIGSIFLTGGFFLLGIAQINILQQGINYRKGERVTVNLAELQRK